MYFTSLLQRARTEYRLIRSYTWFSDCIWLPHLRSVSPPPLFLFLSVQEKCRLGSSQHKSCHRGGAPVVLLKLIGFPYTCRQRCTFAPPPPQHHNHNTTTTNTRAFTVHRTLATVLFLLFNRIQTIGTDCTRKCTLPLHGSLVALLHPL